MATKKSKILRDKKFLKELEDNFPQVKNLVTFQGGVTMFYNKEARFGGHRPVKQSTEDLLFERLMIYFDAGLGRTLTAMYQLDEKIYFLQFETDTMGSHHITAMADPMFITFQNATGDEYDKLLDNLGRHCHTFKMTPEELKKYVTLFIKDGEDWIKTLSTCTK